MIARAYRSPYPPAFAGLFVSVIVMLLFEFDLVDQVKLLA